MGTILSMIPIGAATVFCCLSLVHHAGAEAVEKDAEPKSAIQIQMEREYFQKMSDFIDSDEFLKIVEREKDFARKSGMNPDFFAAGLIQGVNLYCRLNVMLREGESTRHPLRTRWKSKDEFDAGLVRGHNIGMQHGRDIFDAILMTVQEKFSKE